MNAAFAIARLIKFKINTGSIGFESRTRSTAFKAPVALNPALVGPGGAGIRSTRRSPRRSLLTLSGFLLLITSRAFIRGTSGCCRGANTVSKILERRRTLLSPCRSRVNPRLVMAVVPSSSDGTYPTRNDRTVELLAS